ncbi:MAG: MSHA biogenesis protein MshJ [Colwellia sp.]|jgi:MSHA biogenesis protein MshJ|tara:strand:+ start:3186 stop:3896 length:711 start_codon:yes stop_codon:yes gene_type:complete
MKQKWQEGGENFLKLTIREQYLILITGLVAIFFILFYVFIDDKMASNTIESKKLAQLSSSNQSLKISVLELQAALQGDPNEETSKKITQYEAKLAKVDTRLLTLTSDLMSPIQMRYALLDLLKFEKGVSLLSFELLGVKPLLSSASPNTVLDSATKGSEASINSNETSAGINLYRHGIKIKLSGRYFDLRDYLTQLEKLPWKFFWQDFNFKLTEYPNSELEIEMYSLGTKKEFVGV